MCPLVLIIILCILLFYVYDCLYICVPHVYMVPTETRRGCLTLETAVLDGGELLSDAGLTL